MEIVIFKELTKPYPCCVMEMINLVMAELRYFMFHVLFISIDYLEQGKAGCLFLFVALTISAML